MKGEQTMPKTTLSELNDRMSGIKGARAVISELLWEAKDAGMNQTQLARAIGMSPQLFHKRVKASNFRLYEMQMIADAIRSDVVIHVSR